MTCDWVEEPQKPEGAPDDWKPPEGWKPKGCKETIEGCFVYATKFLQGKNGSMQAIPIFLVDFPGNARAKGWDMLIDPMTGVSTTRCPGHPFQKEQVGPPVTGERKVQLASVIPAGAQIGPRGVRPLNGNGKVHGS